MPSLRCWSSRLFACATLALTSCTLDTQTEQSGPLAAVKVMNLLQGVDNAAIGFETGTPLSVIAFPSVAPTTGGQYFTVTAGPRQLRVLLTARTVLDSAVTLTANQYYTIFTLGVSGATGTAAPGYLVLVNNVTAVTTGSVRFRFVHAAPNLGPMDVHIVADSGAFSADSRILSGIAYRGSATTERPLGDNRTLCVIPAGVVPAARGTNCTALRFYGVAPGSVMTAALRDQGVGESAPAVLFSLDRAVSN